MLKVLQNSIYVRLFFFSLTLERNVQKCIFLQNYCFFNSWSRRHILPPLADLIIKNYFLEQ